MVITEKTETREFKPRRREPDWIPRTVLGRMVKNREIKSIDEIFMKSMPIKEYEIVDFLLGKGNLHEEILSVRPVTKQGKAGPKNSMKVCVAVGNKNGYIGVGTHSARELSTAMKVAVANAKMNIMPVRMGQWDGYDDLKNTVAVRGSGKCGSVTVKVVPAPMGIGIHYSRVHRKMFELAGIKDIYVKSFGRTKTTENLAKAILLALFNSSQMYIVGQWVDNKEKLGETEANVTKSLNELTIQ